MKRVLLITLFVLIMVPQTVSAQDAYLRIEPTVSSVKGNAGSNVTVPLTLTNPQNKPYSFTITSQDYKPDPNPSNPPLLQTTPIQTYSMHNWLVDRNLSRVITVPAKQSIVYNAVFRVPYSTVDGSYYTAVVFTSATNPDQVFPAPVVITVGSPQPTIKITGLTYGDSTEAQYRYGIFTATVENTGNGLATTQSRLKITDSKGVIVADLQPIASSDILPATTINLTFAPTSALPEDTLTATLTTTDQAGVATDKTLQLDRTKPSQNAQNPEQSISISSYANRTLWVMTGLILAVCLIIFGIYRHTKKPKNPTNPIDEN